MEVRAASIPNKMASTQTHTHTDTHTHTPCEMGLGVERFKALGQR